MAFLDRLKKNTGIKKKTQEKESGKSSSKSEREGQLSVDVYETEKDLIIRSTIAGVKAKDVDISVENGVVTIRGSRKRPDESEENNYFYQECYWGPFSRQLILSGEIDGSKIEAEIKEGVLIVRMPKIRKKKKKKIAIKDEE